MAIDEAAVLAALLSSPRARSEECAVAGSPTPRACGSPCYVQPARRRPVQSHDATEGATPHAPPSGRPGRDRQRPTAPCALRRGTRRASCEDPPPPKRLRLAPGCAPRPSAPAPTLLASAPLAAQPPPYSRDEARRGARRCDRRVSASRVMAGAGPRTGLGRARSTDTRPSRPEKWLGWLATWSGRQLAGRWRDQPSKACSFFPVILSLPAGSLLGHSLGRCEHKLRRAADRGFFDAA